MRIRHFAFDAAQQKQLESEYLWEAARFNLVACVARGAHFSFLMARGRKQMNFLVADSASDWVAESETQTPTHAAQVTRRDLPRDDGSTWHRMQAIIGRRLEKFRRFFLFPLNILTLE